MKIGIIARTWFTSTKGGSERIIERLFEELRKDHEVKVITFDKSDDKDIIQVKLPTIPLAKQAMFSFLASRKINKLKPEACLINQYWAEFSPLLLKVPWVSIIYDIGLFYSERARKHRLKHFVRTNVLGRVTQNARLIIVPSKLTATDLQNYLNAPPEKIKVVPPGIDLDYFKPSPVQHEGINIVCVGRIAPNKGQDILLRAFRSVKRKYPNSRLYLVGGVSKDQSNYHRKLERIVEKLRIDDVVFAGHVSDEVLAKYQNLTDIYVQLLHLKGGERVEVKAGYYNLADIYVQPSIGEEGWGITIVEAFACRKPVICTDIFSRIGVADNDRALIVKSGDVEELAKAIELLIEDKKLRKKIVDNGYSFAQRLSWRETANEIVRALNNLVGN